MPETGEYMSKLAFVFPGQGSQYVGMGKSFYDGFTAARRTFEEADEIFGYKISRLIFEGPKEGLDLTENTQPAILIASVAALRVLREKTDARPCLLAGHSLGEFTALVASGALAFSDAVRLVHKRGRFMQASAPPGTGKMCAILGLDIDAVSVICESASMDAAVAVPANINSPEQIVISGHAGAVDIAAGLARERGARMVVPLQVSAPSHSPLMEQAAKRLDEELRGITLYNMDVPVVTNVEAEPVTDPSRIRELLTRQLVSPVRWVDIIRRMKKEGVGRIVEIGPNRVLTGLVKRIDKEIAAFNLNEASDIDKVVEAVGRRS